MKKMFGLIACFLIASLLATAIVHAEEDKINDKVDYIKDRVKCKILEIVKCGHRGPRLYRYCIDFKVLE